MERKEGGENGLPKLVTRAGVISTHSGNDKWSARDCVRYASSLQYYGQP